MLLKLQQVYSLSRRGEGEGGVATIINKKTGGKVASPLPRRRSAEDGHDPGDKARNICQERGFKKNHDPDPYKGSR